MSLLQQLAALYRIDKEVEVKVGMESETHGFRSWKCWDCSEIEQAERGCWIEGRKMVALCPTQIDYTGDDGQDYIKVCPVALRDPVIDAALRRFPIFESAGGPGPYFDATPADLPSHVNWLYAAIGNVRQRWKAQLQDAHARCLRAHLESTKQNNG